MSSTGLHPKATGHATDAQEDNLHAIALPVATESDLAAVTTGAEGKAYWTRDTKTLYVMDVDGNFIAVNTGASSYWQDPVISKTTTSPPGSPTLGDRYVVPDGATGGWAGLDDYIVQWNGSGWDQTAPFNGMVVEVQDQDVIYLYATSISGGSYVAIGGTGDVFGSGTANYVPMWSASNTLADSGIHYDPATTQYICDVRFKSTGYLFFDNANTTTRVGYNAGANLTTGTKNVLVGESVGVGLTGGNENTAAGYRALYDSAGNQPNSSQNTAFGKDCMGSGAGIGNTAVGLRALSNVNGGSGLSRGAVSTMYSCAFGIDALNQITSGMRDIGIGWDALFSLTTGSDDLGIGREALVGLTTESNNTALGNYAGAYVNGNPAGSVLTGMTYCTFLGEKTAANGNSYTNSTAIGYLANLTKSNQIVYGNTSVVENLFSNTVLISSLAGTGTELALAIQDRTGTPVRQLEFYSAATGSPGGEAGLHLLDGFPLYFPTAGLGYIYAFGRLDTIGPAGYQMTMDDYCTQLNMSYGELFFNDAKIILNRDYACFAGSDPPYGALWFAVNPASNRLAMKDSTGLVSDLARIGDSLSEFGVPTANISMGGYGLTDLGSITTTAALSVLADLGTILSVEAGSGTELAFAVEDRSTTPVRFLEFYAEPILTSPGMEKGLHLLNGAELYMHGGSVHDIVAGTVSGDAVEFDQLGAALADYLPLAGGTMDGAIAMDGNAITGLSAADTAGDAVRYEQTMYTSIGGGFQGWGVPPTAGSVAYIANVPFSGTITGWHMQGNVSGSAVVDVKIDGASIVGAGNKPTLTGAQTANAAAVGWTSVAITAGKAVQFVLDSASVLTDVTFTLEVTKT